MKKIFYLLTITALLMTVLTNCNKEVAVIGVKLNETSLILVVGETKTLMATVLPENATNKFVAWESSDAAVATVALNGQVTAHSSGETTIIVTTVDGAFIAKCKVIVVQPMPEELLTQENGWLLTTAICDPAFETMDGNLITDLFKGFLYDCELDDIIFFHKNYTQYLNFGEILCDWESGTGIRLGNWRIKGDENILEFQLPYFFDENDNFDRLEGRIVVLDSNTLKLQVPIALDDGAKLAKRGFVVSSSKNVRKYEFTLTYTKVNR